MAGRTHGMHAEPTTFGAKLALWCLQADRDRARLRGCAPGHRGGQAVGRGGHVLQHRPPVEAYVCGALGLTPVPATQVIARDRHAELLWACASVGATIEMIATEIRHLARTEVGEVEEAFGAGPEGQLGHAPQAQPRPVRAPVAAWPGCCAATSVPGSRTWRCGTSATSRTARWSASCSPTPACSPTTCCARPPAWSQNLVVHADRMRANVLEGSFGLVFSQPVLLALVASGMTRDAAYRIVQRDARAAWEETPPVPGRARGRPRGHVGRPTRSTEAFSLERALRHVSTFAAATPRRWKREPDTGAQRQGPRALRRRRGPAADGGVGPHLGLRRGPGRAHPRQGAGAHRHDGALPRRAGRPRPEPPHHRRPRRRSPRTRAELGGTPASTGAGAPCSCAGPRCSPSSASCAAIWPGRGGRSTRPVADAARHAAARRPASRPAASPSPCSRRRPRPPRATTSTSRSTRPPTWWARRWPRRPATCAWRPTGAGAAAAERNGIIVADTKFELGFIDGELALCDEVLTPDSSRFWPADEWRPGTNPPAFDKQPRARLARGQRLGQAPATAAVCPTTWCAPPASATSTPTNESAGAVWPTGTVRAGERRVKYEVLVEVRLRPGIADPAGRDHRAGPARARIRGRRRRARRQGLPPLGRGARRGRRCPCQARWPTGCSPTR